MSAMDVRGDQLCGIVTDLPAKILLDSRLAFHLNPLGVHWDWSGISSFLHPGCACHHCSSGVSSRLGPSDLLYKPVTDSFQGHLVPLAE